MSFETITVSRTDNGDVRIEDFGKQLYEPTQDAPDDFLSGPEAEKWNALFPNVVPAMAQEARHTEIARNREYDRVIRCLGWRGDYAFLSPLHDSFRDTFKWATVTPFFESKQVPRLYFAGQLSHGRDWRKSAGGFIHGFRYLARALSRHLLATSEGIPWPRTVYPMSAEIEVELRPLKLADIALGRINQASGTYQMFGQLEDLLVLPGGPLWDCTTFSEAVLIPEVPKSPAARAAVLGNDFQGYYVTLGFQYGANFSYPACTKHPQGCDVFAVGRVQISPEKAHLCNFLHPVFRLYSTYDNHGHSRPIEEFHLVEDLLTFFLLKKKHIDPLVTFFARALKF
jgi:hypothetical protein